MDEIRITGEVESIIYQNADNGYTVFALETEDDEVTCVGIVPQIHAGEKSGNHRTLVYPSPLWQTDSSDQL